MTFSLTYIGGLRVLVVKLRAVLSFDRSGAVLLDQHGTRHETPAAGGDVREGDWHLADKLRFMASGF